ncbi:MAG: DNA repair protein RadC [Candidatus Kapabacteria bacterium]|nr:DNA repair protein RadC [Candidatus Kapabacteria bacterium]
MALALSNWRDEDKPRERLLEVGPEALSDSELLALLVGSGIKGKNVVDLAKEILIEFGSFTELCRQDISALKKISGLGTARATVIVAACELTRRVKTPPFRNKQVFRSPSDVAIYYIHRLRDERKESFRVLLLNTANQVIRDHLVGIGTRNSCDVDIPEVFRIAILESATSIILLHNHPSGNPEASKADKEITKQIAQGASILGMKLLDHLIIAGEQFTSFANEGLL